VAKVSYAAGRELARKEKRPDCVGAFETEQEAGREKSDDRYGFVGVGVAGFGVAGFAAGAAAALTG